MRVLQTHALPLGYRAKLVANRIAQARSKQKTHLPDFWRWVALTFEAETGLYPFRLPAPENTRSPQLQRQHFRGFICGVLKIFVE
jgi:hypothetical protein